MSQSSSISSEQRVLTLLRLLDEEVRGTVLSSLPEDLQERLKERLKNPAGRLPSRRRQEQILADFERMFHCAVKVSGPRLKLHEETDEPLEEDVDVYQPTGDALVDLERMNIFQVASAFENEQPRLVALLLQKLTARRVATILEQLSTEHRSRVVREMSKSPRMPDPLLEKLAQTTVQQAMTFPPKREADPDPIIRMAEILRETEKPRRREFLDSLEEQDVETAAEVQRAIYRFEDLLDIDDRQVQQVLAQIDSETLQAALSDADSELVTKVTRNLSRRAATTLRDELAYQKPIPESQRAAARALIAQAIGTVDTEAVT